MVTKTVITTHRRRPLVCPVAYPVWWTIFLLIPQHYCLDGRMCFSASALLWALSQSNVSSYDTWAELPTYMTRSSWRNNAENSLRITCTKTENPICFSQWNCRGFYATERVLEKMISPRFLSDVLILCYLGHFPLNYRHSTMILSLIELSATRKALYVNWREIGGGRLVWYVNWHKVNCLFGTPGSDRIVTALFSVWVVSKRFIQLLSVHDQRIDVFHVLQYKEYRKCHPIMKHLTITNLSPITREFECTLFNDNCLN